MFDVSVRLPVVVVTIDKPVVLCVVILVMSLSQPELNFLPSLFVDVVQIVDVIGSVPSIIFVVATLVVVDAVVVIIVVASQ